tara:strand:+ start:769 stop:1776 length:1008 start_codon:yes stop_codon:yes gene_type:complete
MGLFDAFSGSAPSIPKPTDIFKANKKTGQTVVGDQLQGVTGYYNQSLPAFLGMQGQYSPQFMDQAFGFGGQALTGLTGLQQTGGAEAARSIGDLRAQELGIMGGQAPLTRGLMDSLSPEQAAAVRASAQEADRATASSMSVSPQEQRMYEQTAREAAQSSGRLGGNAAFASEVMGREDVLARKRAEAAQARQNSYSLASGFYTQPGLGLLGSTPASYGAGTANAGSALGLGQSLGPNLDYNLPLNLARERAGALDARNMAQYQADAQAKSSQMGMFGSLIGAAAIPFTGGLSAGLGLTGMAGGAAGASGLGGLGLSAGMGLSNMFGGGVPRASIV